MPIDRHIPLQGASNFRDFGGYAALDGHTVKWRKLFRSDHLAELTSGDYDVLAEHGIRTVFDLRRQSEATALVTAWPGVAAPELVRSPLFEDATQADTQWRASGDGRSRRDPAWTRAMMGDLYVRLVTEAGPLAALQRIFVRLAEPDAFPVLLHCAAGKDRTGVSCALILSLLGVSRQDVVDDYMLTRRYFNATGHQSKRITQILAADGAQAWTEEALKPIFEVESAYIETVLDRVDGVGGAIPFLTEAVGAPLSALQRIKDALLE